MLVRYEKHLKYIDLLPKNKLMKTVKLNLYDFYAVIGWLIKENKICKEGNKYGLGTKNLENRIDKYTRKIWKTLNEIGYFDTPYLPKLEGISNNNTYAVLYWFVREEKIKYKNGKN